jgi:hypothetical protein
MTISDPFLPQGAVESAIARVLDAERVAQESVKAAEAEAAAITERARALGRAIADRTEWRLRSVRLAFEARAAGEVSMLDAAAAEAGVGHELSGADLARLDAAVATLAARLTDAGR